MACWNNVSAAIVSRAQYICHAHENLQKVPHLVIGEWYIRHVHENFLNTMYSLLLSTSRVREFVA